MSDEFIAEPTFKINQISIGNISEHVDELVDVLAVVCKVDDVSQVIYTRKIILSLTAYLLG